MSCWKNITMNTKNLQMLKDEMSLKYKLRKLSMKDRLRKMKIKNQPIY